MATVNAARRCNIQVHARRKMCDECFQTSLQVNLEVILFNEVIRARCAVLCVTRFNESICVVPHNSLAQPAVAQLHHSCSN